MIEERLDRDDEKNQSEKPTNTRTRIQKQPDNKITEQEQSGEHQNSRLGKQLQNKIMTFQPDAGISGNFGKNIADPDAGKKIAEENTKRGEGERYPLAGENT